MAEPNAPGHTVRSAIGGCRRVELVKAGFGCPHELKLIVALMYQGGIADMN